jgi:hypothetical protein
MEVAVTQPHALTSLYLVTNTAYGFTRTPTLTNAGYVEGFITLSRVRYNYHEGLLKGLIRLMKVY